MQTPAVKPLLPPELQKVELPRSNTGPDRDKGPSVNAVLLGLVSLPGAIVAITVSTPAAAQAPQVDVVSTEALTADALFGSGGVQLAQNEDPRVTELTTKIARLVDRNFSGDTRAAFNHYAGSDHLVSSGELSSLLSDAGVGNFITRGAWVSGIMERLDGNHDSKIGWGEFDTVMRSNSGQA